MTDPTDLRLEELRARVPIVDPRGGQPTPAFIRQWNELVGSLTFTIGAERQQLTNQAQQIIRVQEKSTVPDGILFVKSAADLDPYLSGDAYVLPDKLVIPVGTVDLGDKALEMSTDTVINGLSKGAFMSSNASGVLRATPSVASAVIVHNTVFIATAGPVLALEGPITQQLNLDFVGVFGPSAGTITGYDVSSVKSCFIDCADGITYDGTTNKIFIMASPFYSITGSAIRLAASLVCDVAHIESTFFKFDSPGVGVEAVAGYTVGTGLLVTSLKLGTLTLFSGLSPADTNWKMENNQGSKDSSVIGAYIQDVGTETTTITTAGVAVKANITTSASIYNERFSHANNRLTYIGQDTVSVRLSVETSMGKTSGAGADDAVLRLALNGALITTSRMGATLRASGETVNIGLADVIEMSNGDYVEVFVENVTSTRDITLADTNLTIGQTS